MENPKNLLKEALRAGKPQIGLWSNLASSYTTEVIAGAGFDWILIDMEHAPADIENVLHQLQALAPYPTSAVVRVPWNDMVTIKRVLDTGAQSLLVPQVITAAEAINAVAYARYPKAGVRGVAGGMRATRFGRIADYFRRADEEICLLVQLESGEALKNIEAVAAIDGID
jgi:4-hydroxy-2-oxoheptanedioate aldolase